MHATHETETKKHIRAKSINDIEEKIMKEKNYSKEEAEQYRLSNHMYKKIAETYVDEKMREIKSVHESFLKHNHQIDHVLLNTGTKEDLVEQMRNLIVYYTNQQ